MTETVSEHDALRGGALGGLDLDIIEVAIDDDGDDCDQVQLTGSLLTTRMGLLTEVCNLREDAYCNVVDFSFDVTLAKGEASLGMDVTSRPRPGFQGMTVSRIKDGSLMQAFNQNAADKRVCCGDRIISVNGVTGVNLMLKELRQPSEWVDLKIHRVSGEFHVEVSRAGPLGLDVSKFNDICLAVKNVQQGEIQTWNETAMPQCQVRRGDVIIAVNGESGSASILLDAIKREANLKIHFRRFL